MESKQMVSRSSQQSGRSSRLISRILPPAIRFWIQTQLDEIEDLCFQLSGKDRQILKGYVPVVSLSAARAVYQGLHLSRVQAEATEIYINLGQVVRGKPLRLLQPFPIQAKLVMDEANLNASLQSALLLKALQDFLGQLWAVENSPLRSHFSAPDIEIDAAEVVLQSEVLKLSLASSQATMDLTTTLSVRQGQVLVLERPMLTTQSPSQSKGEQVSLGHFEIDLGNEVNIESLNLKAGELEICGTVRVVPGD